MQPTTPQPGGSPQPDNQGYYKSAEPAPYVGDPQPAPQQPFAADDEQVTWEASEYIHRTKDAKWTISFAVIAFICLVVALWSQVWTFIALVVVMTITMAIFAFRPPHTHQYSLTHNGLQINDRTYGFADFRAFAIMPEDAIYSVVLLPVKRFLPAITVYFAESDGEKIVDILGDHLPMERLQPNFIDSLMRRLHF